MNHEINIVEQLTSTEQSMETCRRGTDFIATPTTLLVMMTTDNDGGAVGMMKNDVHTVQDDDEGQQAAADDMVSVVGSCSSSSEPVTSRLPTWSSTAVMTASPPHSSSSNKQCHQPPTPIMMDGLPHMIRSVSELSSCSDDDDNNDDGDETMATEEMDDDRSSSSLSTSSTVSSTTSDKVKGVTFNESVRVLPIPPLSHYTLEQRQKMYANRFEVRENKLRNKKEYAFDNFDWKNCTEEGSMVICPMSGNLMHPAHF
jgi:hypothetical protein